MPLPQGEARLTVESAEVLGFDEIKAGLVDGVKESEDLAVSSAHSVLKKEAATPVIRAEGFGHATGPNLHTTIGDHGEPKSFHFDFL